jgi:hypothetical protein
MLLPVLPAARGERPAAPVQRCECTACCEHCTCCVSDEEPVPAQRQPARASQGPRLDWAPAEDAVWIAWLRPAAAQHAIAGPAPPSLMGHVRLHARIGVWLN